MLLIDVYSSLNQFFQVNIDVFADDLEIRNGIYFSRRSSPISYPEHGNDLCYQIEENSFWFRHRNNCIIEAIRKNKPAVPFFDIGGGNGFVAKGISDTGVDSALVEPGIRGAENARNRGVATVICSTLEDAGFKAGSLPSAGLFDVIEHIEDDLGFLKKINHYLQDNGQLYITVPAFRFLWSSDDSATGHFRRYTLNDLQGKLELAGFNIKYRTYFFSVLTLPVLLLRTIPTIFGLNKDPINQQKIQKEHTKRLGLATRFLNKIWDWEISMIANGKRIPFGSSCLVVAEKKG